MGSAYSAFIPAKCEQHDAIHFDEGPCRLLSNLSHPFGPFEHLVVNSVNEIACGRVSHAGGLDT